jgi:hypothetical protein
VFKNKDLISFKVLSQSSKLQSFISLHRHHKMHKGTIFHTTATLTNTGSPPKCTKAPSSRHNPRQPNSKEENIPNGTSNLKMKKKMIHGFPIPFAHTTPINHNDAPLPEIVHGKDLS